MAETDPDGQTILFTYPASLSSGTYLAPVVKIELGARSDVDPTRSPTITPYVAQALPSEFTEATFEVRAVAPERTFWEKVLSASYFATLGIPLLHGRLFDDGDEQAAPALAVVNDRGRCQRCPAGTVGQRAFAEGRRGLGCLGPKRRWRDTVQGWHDSAPRHLPGERGDPRAAQGESAAMIRFSPTFRLEKHSRDAIRRFVTSNMSCETIPPARRPPN